MSGNDYTLAYFGQQRPEAVALVVVFVEFVDEMRIHTAPYLSACNTRVRPEQHEPSSVALAS